MAGATQTYRVEAVYDVTDKASKQLKEIAEHAKHAAQHTEGLKHVMMGMAEAALGLGVIEKAKHHFIDFNKEVENSKIALTAMIQSNFDTSFERGSQAAERMYNEFQKFSQLTPVTTKQILEFSQGITVAAAQAGASVAQITKMSEMGVIAGKVLSGDKDAGYVTGELSHMLAGNINMRMQFAKNLLGTMHMTEEQFKALDPTKRLEVIMKGLNSPAMRDAAKAYGNSFAGVTSTLEDKLQIMLGRVGLPLFKAITKEVASWNDWLEKNKEVMEVYIAKAGHKLEEGFRFVKDVFVFIADHAGLLLKVAEAYMAIKIGGMIGGGIGGSIKGVMDSASATGGKIGLGSAGSIAQVGVASYYLGQKFWELTGVTQSLHEAINPQQAALERVNKRLSDFDMAVAKSTDVLRTRFGDTDARSTGKFSTAQVFKQQQIQKQEELFALAKEVSSSPNDLFKTSVAKNMYFSKLTGAGFSDTDARDFLKMAASGKAHDIMLASQEQGIRGTQTGLRYDSAAAVTNTMIALQMAQMTDAQKETVDWTKVSAAALEAILRGEKFDMSKAIKDADPDAGLKGAKVNQNVHIYINQVSAKDPDRWLAEMDDMAAKRARAPTRARSALARGL